MTVDTTIIPPTIDSFSDDTGVQGDGITSDDTPSFAGTCEDGASVTLTFTRYDNANNPVESFSDLAVTTGATWAYDNFINMSDGRWEVTASQTDIAGNVSAESAPFEVTIDTTTPFLTFEAMSNDYEVADDYTTHTDSTQLSGRADPGAVVELTMDGVPLPSVVADANGIWESGSIDLSGLAGGATAELVARVTGVNGLFSEEARTISLVDRIDDLALAHDVTLVGQAADDDFGKSVSNIGDFNGDGIDDFIVGAYQNDLGGTSNAGAAYIMYGSSEGRLDNLNVSSLTAERGFRIIGQEAGDQFGLSVSGAGDVNGDGLMDVIIGAPRFEQGGLAGRAYVIYGKAGHTNMDITSLPTADGYEITNSGVHATGFSVASAGDVNNDGIDDMLVGATTDSAGGSGAGAAYLVFGQAGTPASVNLAALTPAQGIKLTGDMAGDSLGRAVAGLGDVSGDGIEDFLVTAQAQDGNGTNSGAAYVIFGKTSGWANIDLSSLAAADGFALLGAAAGDTLGFSASEVGDFNGDGINDLLVGAHNGAPEGIAYVIYGGTDIANVDLATLTAAQGSQINGVTANGRFGQSVSSAGDVDGDGIDDIIVGVPGSAEKGSTTGSAYVIYGKTGGLGNINVSSLTTQDGFKIEGRIAGSETASTGAGSGTSVSGAGDINGDGFDDLIVGATGPSGTSGTAHIIYGTSRTSQWMVLSGTNADDWITGGSSSDKINGGGGADTILAYGGDDFVTITDTNFTRIDGGEGEDTLVVSGGGIHIDMTALDALAVQGIDVVDLTGSGNNELTITEQDVLDMSDNGLLRIDGNTGDQVHAAGFTDTGADQVVGDSTYDVYTSGAATLWVEQQTLIS